MAVNIPLYRKFGNNVTILKRKHLVICIIRCFLILCLIFPSVMFSNKAYAETGLNNFNKLNGKKILSEHPEQEYYLYVPDNFTGEELWPLFIGVHVYMGNGAAAQGMWQKFASKYKFILVCPSFPDGYQWLKYNTAARMIDIINEVKALGMTNNKTFIAGFSGGAQFAARFSIYYPEYVTAAVVMSAGGLDMPTDSGSKVKFFISVGELDLDPPSRLDKAKKFYSFAIIKGYDIKLTIYPGIGHQHTPQMERDAMNFYESAIMSIK